MVIICSYIAARLLKQIVQTKSAACWLMKPGISPAAIFCVKNKEPSNAGSQPRFCHISRSSCRSKRPRRCRHGRHDGLAKFAAVKLYGLPRGGRAQCRRSRGQAFIERTNLSARADEFYEKFRNRICSTELKKVTISGHIRLQVNGFVLQQAASQSPIRLRLNQTKHFNGSAKLTAFCQSRLWPFKKYPSHDTSSAANYARAIAYFKQLKFTKAIKLLDNLLQREPNNPYFHELKAQIYMEQGKIKAAKAEYAKVLSLRPNAAFAASWLGTSSSSRYALPNRTEKKLLLCLIGHCNAVLPQPDGYYCHKHTALTANRHMRIMPPPNIRCVLANRKSPKDRPQMPWKIIRQQNWN